MGPIGVFDSGMGGLTVLRALRRRLPAEDFIYFGDTARVPYGTKGARTVKAFATQDAAFLAGRGVKLIVVACNTASAFALEHLAAIFPMPLLGVIEPGIARAAACTRGGGIGVIGTRGTIRSGRYQEELARAVPGARVLAYECPLLVPLAEEGMIDHPATELMVAEYLAPLRDAGVDTVILGCTHYPLLKPVIARFLGPAVVLVDSADALADAAAQALEARGLARPTSKAGDDAGETGESAPRGRQEFFLSDLPWKFAEVGARFLGEPIDSVKVINLDEAEAEGHLVYPEKGSR